MNIIRIGGIVAGGNTILVTTDSGATVYAVSGGKVISGVAVGGVAKLKVKAGTWRVWAELDGQQTSEVEVIVTDSYYKEMSFGLKLSALAEGALIQLNESGSGVNFYLAKHDYESGLNGAGRELLVRKDCYDNRQWHSSNNNAYASSTIDSWLNGSYKTVLDSAVKSLIGTTKFYYIIGGGNKNSSTLERSVFLLSLREYGFAYGEDGQGSALPIAETLRTAYLNGSTVAHWTRSPNTSTVGGASGKEYVYALNWVNGTINQSCAGSRGSRPCFTLPAELMVNPTPNADGSYTLMV